MVVSWSGGKDSALALHELLGSPAYRVVGLLTTVTTGYERISVHGVRRSLLEQQARAIGLPLRTVEIGPGAANEEYAARQTEALRALRIEEGVDTIAFGDLFLADVRRYREELLEAAGARPLFPLWGRDAGALAREFLRLGFGAVLTCVDTQALHPSFAGREYDPSLLADLPPHADPCGENGEFHTFVYRGPLFSAPVPFRPGEQVLREGRVQYCDLL